MHRANPHRVARGRWGSQHGNVIKNTIFNFTVGDDEELFNNMTFSPFYNYTLVITS